MMMRPLYIGLAAVLLSLEFILAVRGQECEGPFTLNGADDLAELLGGCTTVLGDIIIENTFDGPLNLNSVTNITGNITTPSNSSQQNNTVDSMTNVTSFDAPELLSVGTLDLDALPYATRIRLPKLENVDKLLRIDADRYLLDNDGLEVDVPGIVEIPSLVLEGRFSRLDFTSLENVFDELRVDLCSGTTCRHRSMPSFIPPLAVTFPALGSAGLLNVTGALASIFFPKLGSVGPLSSSSNPEPGMILKAGPGGLAIDVELPLLSSATGLFIEGGIQRLSMPELLYTNASIRIGSSQRLNVELSLVEAASIYLTGKVESAAFPNLTAFEAISITSKDINCDSFLDDLDQAPVDITDRRVSCRGDDDINNLIDDILGTGDDSAQDSSGVHDTSSDSGGGLDTKEKILIGLLVPFGALVAIALLYGCCCGRCCMPVHVEKTQIPEQNQQSETPARPIMTAPSARAEGPIRRDEISSQPPPIPSIAGSRSSSPPPPYSPRAP